MIKNIGGFLLTGALFLTLSCGGMGKSALVPQIPESDIYTEPFTTEKLPADIEWLTNDSDPVFASPEAVKGGHVNSYLSEFPPTFRIVGPDSNHSFRDVILNNNLTLIDIHPNTGNIIPELATHWAFDKDGRTMYFKLNPAARWSDGRPVTAMDFVYNKIFMRSKFIVAPYYNDYFTNIIEDIIAYDDYTIAIKTKNTDPDLYLAINISPLPRHFYGKLDKDYPVKYNWLIQPGTGAYTVTGFVKGKSVDVRRVKDWWAADLKYFKNRFNVDSFRFNVILDPNMIFDYLIKGKIDAFEITNPIFYRDKSNVKEFNNGYINKIWFFNDMPRSPAGLFLNNDDPLFKDRDLRVAFSHAVNIDKVIETVIRGEYYRLDHEFVGYGEYSNENIKARKFNITEVEKIMTGKSWVRGNDGIWGKGTERFTVQLTYSSDLQTERLVVLKEEAKKAGVEINLDLIDSSAGYKKGKEKKFQAIMWAWSTNSRPEYWHEHHSENAHKAQTNNLANMDNKQLDKLIDKYRFSPSKEERVVLSKKIQEIIHDEASFVPFYMIPYARFAGWRWLRLPETPAVKVSDNCFEPFSPQYGGLFWIDEAMYKETKEAMKSGKTFEPVEIIDKTYMPAGIRDKN